jgi:hypothetical protein
VFCQLISKAEREILDIASALKMPEKERPEPFVIIPDVRVDVFTKIVCYIHTAYIDIEPKEAAGNFAIASKHQAYLTGNHIRPRPPAQS